LILSGIAVLLILLPLIAMGGYFGDLAKVIGQVVLTIVLVLGVVATGLFGYICIRAQARKWGAGLILLAVLFVILIYWVWAGHLPLL
jgi:hypothetical protein